MEQKKTKPVSRLHAKFALDSDRLMTKFVKPVSRLHAEFAAQASKLYIRCWQPTNKEKPLWTKPVMCGWPPERYLTKIIESTLENKRYTSAAGVEYEALIALEENNADVPPTDI